MTKVESDYVDCFRDDNMLYADDFIPISIFELAFRCKSWVAKRGYDLSSAWYQDCSVIDLKTGKEVHLVTTSILSDQKECIDIFKATQWILDNKKGLVEMDYHEQCQDKRNIQ